MNPRNTPLRALALGLYAACSEDAPEAILADRAGRGGANDAAVASAGTSSADSWTGGASNVAGAGARASSGGSSTAEQAGSGGTRDEPGGARNHGDAGAGGGAGGDAGQPLDAFELVVIGSSTSAGEGASSASRGWVSLLSKALDDAVATSFGLKNFSVSGYSSKNLEAGSGDRGNIDAALAERPDLVLVALAGSNDLSSGTSKQTFFARLHAMRDAARDSGVPVFFLSTAPKDLGRSEREALKDWADSMATSFTTCWVPGGSTEYPGCFVPIFDALANASLGIRSELGAGDGIHLNDAGHRRIFELAEAVTRPYVCSRTRCR